MGEEPAELARSATDTQILPNRARTAFALGVAAFLALAACTGTDSSQIGSASTETPPNQVAVSEALPERDPILGNGETISVAFGGDASFEHLDSSLATNPAGLLSDIAPVFQSADLGIANLEAALTTSGEPSAKAFNFRVPADALDALSSAGIQVVSAANNHGMDYGQSGFSETLEIQSRSEADHGVTVLGVGENAEAAYAPTIVEVKGQKVAIFAANDVFDTSLETDWTATDSQPGLASAREGSRQDQITDGIEEVRDSVDTVIVYLHMGREGDTCPTQRQEELTDSLHAAGADLVLGTHAHRQQGAGFRNGHFVAYGLGNFIFNGHSAESRTAAVLKVDVTGRRVDGYEWIPATLQNNIPVPLSGSSAESALAVLDEKRVCAGLAAQPGNEQITDELAEESVPIE